MKQYNPGDVVTVEFINKFSSNTFIVNQDLDDFVLLSHPLADNLIVKYHKSKLDTVSPNIKDSIERGLDFAKLHQTYLDANVRMDLEMLCLYFVIHRRFSGKHKNMLSHICGQIATVLLNNDVAAAITTIQTNEALLDDFNGMWYNNFSDLFSGAKKIVSQKQRAAIFNIAGFILSELGRPTANR